MSLPFVPGPLHALQALCTACIPASRSTAVAAVIGRPIATRVWPQPNEDS